MLRAPAMLAAAIGLASLGVCLLLARVDELPAVVWLAAVGGQVSGVVALVLAIRDRKLFGPRSWVPAIAGALGAFGPMLFVKLGVDSGRYPKLDLAVAIASCVQIAGLAIVVRAVLRLREAKSGKGLALVAGAAGGALAASAYVGELFVFAIGSAWGRPLRIRGQQVHPNLKRGADWTEGDRPDPAGLDEATRAALEALWLHDAQKEHASVPAFSRVSWLLAAVGAPAELLAWSHRAALEEIEHTRRCFALAAGYAGRSFTVEAMPELLLGGLDEVRDPLVTLAVESLTDGCQLEDFNADVAGLCAEVCEEPVTREVLAQIAREERSHAELSWAIVRFTIERDRARVLPELHAALARLGAYPRPTAVSAESATLVDRANQARLRQHGRLAALEWQAAWDARLVATRKRATALVERNGVRAA